ncbi:MAG TPA: hypothetical protein DCS93_27440 [Microscillaceae bacterium]|nr:hypothetical protein [Microscillaceae bacterium]
MKKRLIYISFLVALMAIGSLGTLYGIPYLVMSKVKSRLGLTVPNQFRHSPLMDHTQRAVVRPNPNFLYSIGQFDLTDGPIKITGQIPDSTYWSIAFYKNNTVNFFVKNDQQFKHKSFSIMLKPKGYELKPDKGTQVVEAASTTGIVLVRLLVPNRKKQTVAHFKEFQQSLRIKPLN